MRIGVAGWPLRLFPYPETTFSLDWAQRNGFDGVEITDNFFDYVAADTSLLKSFKEECDKRDLEIAALEPLWIVLFRDEDGKQESVAKIDRSLEVAKLLGAQLVILSPYQEMPRGFEPQDSDFEEAAEMIRPLVRRAAGNGVRLICEGPHGQILRTSDDILKLVQLVDDPDFGINLDFANALGRLRQRDETMEDLVRKLRDYVVYTHVKSLQPVRGAGQTNWIGAPAGEGAINYRAVLPILAEAGFQGYLSIEKTGDEGDPFPQMKQSLDYLVEVLKDLGIPRTGG
jgi:sugar phosphate isomerase/epimerase